RIHRYLLDAVDPEALGCVSASKGRTVAEQFAHVHNVRLLWLGAAAPELMEGLAKIEKGQPAGKEDLAAALTASANAVEVLLRKSLASGGRIKGWKPHAVAFLGYLISHESHHRGQIVLTLKQAGHPVDRKTAFGLWEWGVR
ncbi:MAG TPA: DinB family protein, partial [Thermoanaerobaculia bacterium]|nr:DinB family protein [Thermoanaerobaculia bacterium]